MSTTSRPCRQAAEEVETHMGRTAAADLVDFRQVYWRFPRGDVEGESSLYSFLQSQRGRYRADKLGVDLATGTGTGSGGPVIAPTQLRITGFNDPDGCVIAKETGDDPDFGFAFCHLNAYNVSVGQTLQRGDIIGTEGNRAQLGQVGTHLHFEIYKPEAPAVVYPYQGWNLDPEPILKEKGAWAS
ncbi:M23 family metallopeptidase (plasmid) [Arthrobacter sp. zg-Y820]|uniref:M23 family metallopeptidase n=1 Tax=unclassified Arthrobacter TaxID=235627 RepID=UPI001E3B2B82|nr:MULTISPECIES: M23 family metallopeptidase [unclassified Arthrobacter]MCC9198512.1 M23 family metallopeptidase [Arthrobacter sp. zg-Y820]MDK1281382.1 M23 family metallopeptidase [Arthrobacter sp. zg.Y820]WIB11226.1 M23 family metallopeptidase [Arthrobacter sp. zg-Y820]